MRYRSFRYKIFNITNIIMLLVATLICLYPFVNNLAIALNDGTDTLMGGLTIFPRKFTLDNFIFVLGQGAVQQAFLVTVSRVILVTILSIILLFAAAYGLSKKDLPGRNALLKYFMLPMFISAGLIPKYILFGLLGLKDNYWVYILPGLFSFFNIVIIKANINTIPDSLFESAKLDGAGEVKVLYKIVLPLSLPILATVALWTAVANWSDWTTTLYFCSNNKDLYTLQYYIRMFMTQAQVIMEMVQKGVLAGGSEIKPISLQAAQIMITTIPIVCTYPFLQKYFISGVITGSVKE
jgi:putative aldouronate transport system permease protein